MSVCSVWGLRSIAKRRLCGEFQRKGVVLGKRGDSLKAHLKGDSGEKEPNSGLGEPKESLPYARVPRPALWFSQLRPLGGWSVFPLPLWRYHTEPLSCYKVPRW